MTDLSWPTVPTSWDGNQMQLEPIPHTQEAQNQNANTFGTRDHAPSTLPNHSRHDGDMYHRNLDRHSVFRLGPRPDLKSSHEPEDSVHFVHCILRHGDTRVFVDAPNILTDPRRRTNCDGVVPSNQSFLVHSEHLLQLRDSKFAQMLDNEIYQARVRRRRKPTEDMMKGVKYLLDLTPPYEGDELVFQMTELSLTPGIVKWWNADQLHGVIPNLVKGHDDICTCLQDEQAEKLQNEKRKEMYSGKSPTQFISELLGSDEGESSDETKGAEGALATEAVTETVAEARKEDEQENVPLPPAPENLLRLRAKGQNEICKTPSHFQIPDYCPFRHCHGIIRLLMMIEGKSVNLNSAARVWTMVGISKIFECTSVVRDQVAQWIMSNSRFIEVLPEESLSIGFTLQLPQVTQSAFRILVNELALDEASDKDKEKPLVTMFGRRWGDPGDERNNLIQHAARALIERVNSQFAQLLNPDLFDFWELGVWSRLREIEHLLVTEDDGTFGEALKQLRTLMVALVHKVTSRVESIVGDDAYCRDAYPQMDRDRATYVAPMDFEQIQHIVPRLNHTQRLLLPFTYNELGRQYENNLFYGQKSSHRGSCNQYFSHMVRDLENELQRLVDNKPARGYSDSWQMLLQNDSSSHLAGLGMLGSHLSDEYPRPRARFISTPVVDLDGLEIEVRHCLRHFTRSWERLEGFVPPPNITRHLLLTLTNNEMKFLPLWADGNDDGTGGVFESFLPPAEMGPSGPGPAYHTGLTVPSGPPSLSGSLMEEISTMKIQSSMTSGSVDVQDSISTVYRPDKVIAADSSVASESFAENNSDYDRAKFEVPAEHQATGQSVDMLVNVPEDDSDDTISDATEIGPYASDDDISDRDVSEDGNRSTSNSDTENMVLV